MGGDDAISHNCILWSNNMDTWLDWSWTLVKRGGCL